MIKNNIKTAFFVLTTLFALNESHINAKCSSSECNNLNKFSLNADNKNIKIWNENFFKNVNISSNAQFQINKNLEEEIYELNKFIDSILASNIETDNVSSESFAYEIDSDTQYLEDDIFYAEGNVNILLPNGILNADKISYDKTNKIFKAYSNLNVTKGNQFFKADFLEYNFFESKGYIKNIFGILNFETINNDLKLKNQIIVNEVSPNTNLDFNDLPSEVELLNSTNERYKNSIAEKKIRFNFSKIKNWRFNSKRIDLEGNKWRADLINFTNDPFNKPQLIIKSKKFVGEIKNSKTKFISNSTSLNFEDKLTIPIIGRRTITNDDNNLRWGIGYESGDKDGFFILRNFDSVELNKNLLIDFQPYFLLQRAIEGNSDSFRKRDSKVLSDNFKKDINFYDYFGINTKLKGNFEKWNLNVNLDSKTLNRENFYDAFSGDLNLVRNLYSFSPKKIRNLNQSSDNKYFVNNNLENYSTDFGFYSTFDKDDIYFSYGNKLLTSYKFKKENLNKDYSLVLDIGKFQGRSLKDSTFLENLTRYGVNTSLTHKYRISLLNKESNYSDEYNKTPKLIDNGLFLNAKLGAGIFEYSNQKSQSIVSFMVGPSYTYGDLKKNFLDYTKISIYPELLLKSGESPFVFDNFNEDSRVKFDLKQQIYGPFILGFEGNYNINSESNNYGTFQNKIISLELSKRAYSLGLSYSQDDKSIFFGFEIFNFGDSNFNKEF